jgi:hypothetical protein
LELWESILYTISMRDIINLSLVNTECNRIVVTTTPTLFWRRRLEARGLRTNFPGNEAASFSLITHLMESEDDVITESILSRYWDMMRFLLLNNWIIDRYSVNVKTHLDRHLYACIENKDDEMVRFFFGEAKMGSRDHARFDIEIGNGTATVLMAGNPNVDISGLIRRLHKKVLEIFTAILESRLPTPSYCLDMMIHACNMGDIDSVRLVMSSGIIDLSSVEFFKACADAPVWMIDVMFESGIDLTLHDNKLFTEWLHNGKEDHVISLLRYGVDPTLGESPNYPAIVSACNQGLERVVSSFLKHRAIDPAVNNSQALRVAIYRDAHSVVKLLVEDGRCDTHILDDKDVKLARDGSNSIQLPHILLFSLSIFIFSLSLILCNM